eukprot:TRINITY_DN294_c0_g1_i1.p1 TRINITY_DN294_c0_g1~~TRINITY_DN294_c0_g1_i1.p1  ORF type:complete len:148 (-),score=46.69 TRINITY_DN294_c0_g1_i1:225-668(-)
MSKKPKATEEEDFDEEKFEDANANVDEGQQLENQQRKKTEVQSLLLRNQLQEALVVSLTNPPLGKNQEAKKLASDAVLSTLTQVKEAEIEKIVAALNPEQLNLLMKYVYRGLELAQNSGHLLKWHAVVTDKGGLGTIMRVLTDRNTV